LEDDEDVAETTLQLVFFDGEEAFKSWTTTDSIYGARFVMIADNERQITLTVFQTLSGEMGHYIYGTPLEA
jgi:hypothetical protein